jgi:hypothetical protein
MYLMHILQRAPKSSHEAKPEDLHCSENVAFDAVSCATVPDSREGGLAKWLKIKNLENHLCDYEPGGSGTSTQMANQATRRYSRLALPSTRRLLVILSSRVTHLNNRSIGKQAGTSLKTNLWRQPAAGRPIVCAIETNHASRLVLLYSCSGPREGTVISDTVSVSNCARSTNSSSADRGCLARR